MDLFFRSAAHLESFLEPRTGSMRFRFLSGILADTTGFHLISGEDIGAITALVLQQPERAAPTAMGAAPSSGAGRYT